VFSLKKGLLVLLFLLTACTTGNSNEEIQQVESQETIVTKDSIEVLAENLQVPWSMNKRGDTFYISERTGHMYEGCGGRTVKAKGGAKKTTSYGGGGRLIRICACP